MEAKPKENNKSQILADINEYEQIGDQQMHTNINKFEQVATKCNKQQQIATNIDKQLQISTDMKKCKQDQQRQSQI